MKLILLGICLALVASHPSEENNRDGRNIITDLLGNIGILRVIPRQCTSTSSLLRTGMCTLDNDCTQLGGAIAGECRIGTCCVVPAVCNTLTKAKRSWYINMGFPGASEPSARKPCELIIQRSDENIKQVKLDFETMTLTPTARGSCITDSFHVLIEQEDGTEKEITPVLCGDNSGQHMYVNMPPDGSKLKIRTELGDVRRDENSVDRQWRVLITQLDGTETAPPKCLQYYDKQTGNVRSLNYESGDIMYASDLEYDICFKSLDSFEKEVAEDGDPSAINVCTRAAFGVNLQQSFARRGSKRVVRRAEKVSGMKTKEISEVKSQIEKVVSQLSEESGLRSVVKEANKMLKKGPTTKKKDALPKDNSNLNEIDIVHAEPEMIKLNIDSNLFNEQDKVVKTNDEDKKEFGMSMLGESEKATKVSSALNSELPIPEESTLEVVESEDTPASNLDALVSEVLANIPEKPIVNKVLKNKNSNIVTDEMQNMMDSPDCGGNYLVVNTEKICGSFVRSSLVEEGQDDRFINMDRVSLRSLGKPRTAMRFAFDYRVMCTKSTTTTEAPTTLSPATNSTTERRVNIIRYLLGLY